MSTDPLADVHHRLDHLEAQNRSLTGKIRRLRLLAAGSVIILVLGVVVAWRAADGIVETRKLRLLDNKGTVRVELAYDRFAVYDDRGDATFEFDTSGLRRFDPFPDARKSGNESSAIGTLRAINNAQGLYQQRDSDRNATQDYANSIRMLSSYDLIDDVVASGTKSGYYFTMVEARLYSWDVRAYPAEPGVTGDRYFKLIQDGIIKFKRDITDPDESWRAIE